MRPTIRLAGLLAGLTAAAGLAPLALAAPPAASAPAPAGQRVAKGAVVRVDLSRLPSRVERRGTALCVGRRVTATGAAEEVRCQRPFAYDAPVSGDPLVLVFQPADGGRPVRWEVAYERDPRPRTFTAPAAGTVSTEAPPAPAPAAAPAKGQPPALPPDQAAKAKTTAEATCGECRGAPAFTLLDYTIEAVPPASQEIVIDVRQPAP